MAKTIIALEKGTWSVDREPVAVKPGQPVTFLNEAAADYLLTALDGNEQRRALSEAEWAEALAQHGMAPATAPAEPAVLEPTVLETGAIVDLGAGDTDPTAATDVEALPDEPVVSTAKPKKPRR